MKVGDYVRTDTRGIWQLDHIIERPRVKYKLRLKKHYDSCTGYIRVEEKRIIKSSPNILDLLEEGDILKVNDFKDVYTIYEVEMFRNPYTNEKYLGIRSDIVKKPKRLYEIPLINLSIVTHEQFESMKYKLGE